MSNTLRDNAATGRFELVIGGQVVFAVYERRPSVLAIKHVEAPIPLRGTGAASELMQGIVDIARAEGRKITPLCGYARAWIRRHHEYHDLLT